MRDIIKEGMCLQHFFSTVIDLLITVQTFLNTHLPFFFFFFWILELTNRHSMRLFYLLGTDVKTLPTILS